jgi:N-methylhydantoinase A/oxoprolinase/acetone carboxylase beta subunit
VRLERRAEVRVLGQAHELSIDALPLATLAARFHALHERRYGFADPEAALQIVTVEVGGWLPASLPRERRTAASSPPARAARVRVWHDGRALQALAFGRDAMRPGRRYDGPAVVSDDGATLWVAPGWSARLHASGAVVVTPRRPV